MLKLIKNKIQIRYLTQLPRKYCKIDRFLLRLTHFTSYSTAFKTLDEISIFNDDMNQSWGFYEAGGLSGAACARVPKDILSSIHASSTTPFITAGACNCHFCHSSARALLAYTHLLIFSSADLMAAARNDDDDARRSHTAPCILL